MEQKDPNVDTGLEQLIEMMDSSGASPEEINDAITLYKEENKIEPKAVEGESGDKDPQSKEKARESVSNVIDEYANGFWAEDRLVPELRRVLGSKYTVEKDISEGAEGGSRLSVNNITITNPNGVSHAFQLNRDSTKTEVLDFLESKATEKDAKYGKGEEWVKDKEDFESDFLSSYFTEDKLKQIEVGELTEDDVIKQVKDDIGANDWFFQEGRSEYLNLSDSDLDHVIKDAYNAELGGRKDKRVESLAGDFVNRIQSGDYTYTDNDGNTTKAVNEKEFFSLYRNDMISLMGEEEGALATLNMQLLHGGLNREERLSAESQRDEAVKKMKAKGEYEMFFDVNTGELIRKPKDHDPFSNEENVEDQVEEVMSGIQNDIDTASEDMSPLDIVEMRFAKNAKAISEIYALYNEDATVHGKTYGTTAAYREGVYELKEASSEDIKRMRPGEDKGKETFTFRDFMKMTAHQDKRYRDRKGFFTTDIINADLTSRADMTPEEHRDYRNVIRDQLLSLQLEQEALNRMYLLNEDLTTVEKRKGQHAGKLAIEGLAKVLNPNIGTSADVDRGSGFTEREVLDEMQGILTTSGVPLTAEATNYVERGIGETVGEGLAGATGILAEFAVANKATAVISGMKLFKGGKSLTQIIKANKAKRFTDGNRIYTQAQIETHAAAAGFGTGEKAMQKWLLTNAPKGGKWKGIPPSPINLWKARALVAGVEGAKFASLPSSAGDRVGAFATGFGFGFAGDMLQPFMGTLNAPALKKRFKQAGVSEYGKVPAWLINASPKLEKMYRLSFKGPASFVVGSELGEVSLALTDDMLGYEEFSTFMDEHYGDADENLKRWASNYAIGVGFGLVPGHGAYKKTSTLASLRKAKNSAYDKFMTRSEDYKVKSKESGKELVLTPEQWYKMDPSKYDVIKKPGDSMPREFDANGNKLSPEYIAKYYEIAQGLEKQIRVSEDGLDYTDQLLGIFKLEKTTKKQVQAYKDAGYKVEVERAMTEDIVDKDGNVVMEGLDSRNAEVGYKDSNGNKVYEPKKGDTIIVRYNAERFSEGLAPHELGHAGMMILFGQNARFKSEFLQQMMNIAKDIKVAGENYTLYDRMVEMEGKGWDVENRSWEAARINDWEVFSYLAEYLAKPENLRSIVEADGFSKYKDLIGTAGDKLGQKYNLTKRADVVSFFANYIETINKGSNSIEMLKHLEDVISPELTEYTAKRRKAYADNGMPLTEGDRLSSLSERKKELIKENVRLLNEKPEGYEAQMRDNVNEVRAISEQLTINRAPVGEGDDARKERVNNIEAANRDVIFEKDAVGRNEQRRGEAIDAIIGSYRGKTIAIAKSQGRFETPTFENMSTREKENFAWEMTQPELIKHLDAFNRKFRETGEGVENTDLDGYLNSYLTRKLGTALEKKGVQKKEFTDTTADLRPDQEPAYVPNEMKLNTRTDARLKIDIREHMSDLAQPGRAEQIEQGIKDLNNHAKDYIEKSTDLDGSYRGLKNIKTPKDIVDKVFGKNTKERVETIGNTLDVAKKSALPQGTLSTRTGSEKLEGKSIGVANTLQTINISKKGKPSNYKEVLYGTPKRSAEFTSKETGRLTAEADPTGQGNTPKELLKLSKAETLKRLGIKEVELGGGEVTYDVDQSLVNEWAKEPGAKSAKDLARNIDGIRKNYMEEVVRGMNYQASMDNLPAIAKKLALTTEVLTNQIGAGKARLASRTLELADFKDQIDFLKQVESKEFNKLYNKAMREFEDGAKAFDHAMVTHFANNPIKGISKAEIKKISAELNKHFQYTTMTPKRAAEAAQKAIAFPNSLKAVEGKFGKEALNTIDLFNSIESIREAQAVFTMDGGIMEVLALRHGKGVFEALLKEATHTGTGLGTFESIRRDVTFDTNWRRAGEHMLEFLRADKIEAPKESLFLYKNRSEEIQKALDIFKDISKFTENPGNIYSHVKGPLTWTNMGKAMIKFLKAEKIDAPAENAIEGGLYDKYIATIKEAMKLSKEVTYFTNSKFKEYRGGKIEVIETAESRALLAETLGTTGKGSNRFAIYETSAQAQAAVDAVYARLEAKGVKLKTYEGSTAARSNEVGKKEAVLEGVTNKNGKDWNLEGREKFENAGEENKAKLLEVSEIVKDLYKSGDITHRQVRQLIEAQGGPMQGLIKKSASLAILPEISRAEVEAIYGKEWVLEHTTPAQYIKARMYEYVLSGGVKRYKNTFEAALKDYHTTLIPKSLDTMVNKILKTDLTSDHVPGAMDPMESRYIRAYHESPFDLAMINHKNGKRYSNTVLTGKELQQRSTQLRRAYEDFLPEHARLASKDMSLSGMLKGMKIVDAALANGRKRNAERKGMSTWDFDDTLAHTKSDVLFTAPNGKKGKLNAAEFAEKGSEMLEQGYKFDFSEFNKVTGGEPGPFLEKALERAKKFGTKDQFILTARAPEAAPAIREFLKSQGLDIPLENIVGLGNSTAEAKARWMLERFAEGYNDMYFADDAMQNVKAVRDVLSQLDIKSNVQQARRLASDNLDISINEMIERGSGIGAMKEFSAAKAKMLGRRRFPKSLVVPGAQDFMGLMYNFVGEGKQGNKDIKFFEDNMVAPFARATKVMNEARQKSSEDLKRLYKDIPSVKKKLNSNLENSAFTYDQAIRTYLWEKAGHEIPGLSAKDLKQMTDVVKGDAELKAFADGLTAVSKGGYVKPSETWVTETIVSDLFNLNNRANRSEFMAEWVENKNIIFSEKNLNKIEATQGTKFRDALEDMLYRVETGSNRPRGSNKLANAHMNFINGSVGATMFLNMRSAALQTISATNYLNWKENNPAKAAAAFGNQKQYWKDFSMIWNSPMLKQRRAGLEYNVQEAELAAAVAGQKNKAKAAMAWLIKKGFTPTQLADSFAIAAGGSTYYRNRLKMYEKQGLSKVEAEKQAWLDFQETTEKAQQSSRADLISQQQASTLGRTILAWANTPMQYMRLQEKAARDIINKRGDLKSNVSVIAYYGALQSLVFASLQSALFAYGLDEEEDIDDADFVKTVDRITNTVIDGQLRGMGVGGAAVSAIKNTILEFDKQELKATDDSWFSEPDHVRTALQLTGYSPVVSSKLKKLYSAGNTWNYNRDVIQHMGFDLQNPAIEAGANVIEATTNIPMARLVRKIDNLREVADSENQNWQRVAALGGYARWDIGLENEAVNEAKKEVKAIKAVEAEERKEVKKAEKAAEKAEENEFIEEVFLEDQRREIQDNKKDITCAAVTSSGKRCGKTILKGQSYCTIHEKVEKNDTGKKAQCKHTKKDGKRCKVKTANKSGLCYYHD